MSVRKRPQKRKSLTVGRIQKAIEALRVGQREPLLDKQGGNPPPLTCWIHSKAIEVCNSVPEDSQQFVPPFPITPPRSRLRVRRRCFKTHSNVFGWSRTGTRNLASSH